MSGGTANVLHSLNPEPPSAAPKEPQPYPHHHLRLTRYINTPQWGKDRSHQDLENVTLIQELRHDLENVTLVYELCFDLFHLSNILFSKSLFTFDNPKETKRSLLTLKVPGL